MMDAYSIYLPSYTIGENIYSDSIGPVCTPHGTTAVIIGGKRAMAAAADSIEAAARKAGLCVLGRVWYGGECSFENVSLLSENETVKKADMIFAVGGGKATDTSKATANMLKKPVFTFPTIASNCSACTSVSIMYHPDGSFLRPFFFDQPPVHAFIDLGIISKSPERYMWAGMGDTYAKFFESTVSSRGEHLRHYVRLGVTVSAMCLEPILEYGTQALKDNKNGVVSEAFKETVLSIIVSTALASILLTKDQIIDYNTGLAHAIFYALTSYEHIEARHLHGEVVGFGVLILLLTDGQQEMFEKVHAFNRSIALPTCLDDIEISADELPNVIEKTLLMKDIDHNPYPVTRSMLKQAFEALNVYNRDHTAPPVIVPAALPETR